MPRVDPQRLAFMPIDLHHWDHSVSGDLVIFPLWEDVRPLRGAAGLCDWRLCGQLSSLIQQGKLSGALGEKTILKSLRLPWSQIVILGIGTQAAFSIPVYRTSLSEALECVHGMDSKLPALALPGRDSDLIAPEAAINELVGLDLSFLNRKRFPILTLLDASQVLKNMKIAAQNHV